MTHVEPPADGSALDDAAVIARVLAGDTQEFACLIARYQRSLYRYAVSIMLDHDAAADMVQDAFVRAYAGLRTCRDHARFRPWLFQLLRNRCLDVLKAAGRKRVSLEDAGPLVDAAEGPDDRADRLRLRAEIRTALAALPVAQREAFLMHYVEGAAYEEMSERLDVSVSALKMRVLRARASLALALQRRHVTEPPAARLSIEHPLSVDRTR
jgi:RNA polymerase sigma-70 factor (ECF subfamily)